MTADDIGPLVVLTLCLTTLPLIGWNVYLDRRRRELSLVRLLMWFGWGTFVVGTAARNAVFLGWVGADVRSLAIVGQVVGLAIMNYGFVLTGLALVKRAAADDRGGPGV